MVGANLFTKVAPFVNQICDLLNLIKSLNVLEGDSEGALDVRFSPDGNSFITINRNGQVRLWDRDGNPIRVFEKIYVQDAEFNPSGAVIAVAYVDGSVGLWDVNSGALIDLIDGGMEEVYDISWSPNGQVLAWCGLNGHITLWSVTDSKVLVRVGNSEWNIEIEFSPDGRFLLSSGYDIVQLWGIP